ncbi:MAG: hypothetical protein WAX69_01575, partial [Victivallales bacterium]
MACGPGMAYNISKDKPDAGIKENLPMPFKSKAQLRKFAVLVEQGKMKPKVFKEWLEATPSVKKLPE